MQTIKDELPMVRNEYEQLLMLTIKACHDKCNFAPETCKNCPIFGMKKYILVNKL